MGCDRATRKGGEGILAFTIDRNPHLRMLVGKCDVVRLVTASDRKGLQSWGGGMSGPLGWQVPKGVLS
jgi:hypothetical protein